MGVEKTFRIAVLASGRGSNFVALATAIKKGIIPNAEIISLISNKKSAMAIEHAENLHVPVRLIQSSKFKKDGKPDREAYEAVLIRTLEELNPDWICLAGYMLVLGKKVVERFAGKIINIHPSLLPLFRGLHATAQALEAGASETGCTVHFVTEGLDDGPIILQNKVRVEAADTDETLSQRLLPIEHATYVEALRRLCSQKFEIKNDKVLFY